MDLKQSVEKLSAEIHSVHMLVSNLDRDRVHTDRRIDELSSNLAAFRAEVKEEIAHETKRVEEAVASKAEEAEVRTAELEKRVGKLELSNEDLSFVRAVANNARGWFGKAVAGSLILMIVFGIVLIGVGYFGLNFSK